MGLPERLSEKDIKKITAYKKALLAPLYLVEDYEDIFNPEDYLIKLNGVLQKLPELLEDKVNAHIDRVKKICRWEDIEKTDEIFLEELTPEEKNLVLRNRELMDEFEKKTIEELIGDYGCMVVAKLTPAISKILSYRNSLNVIHRGHIVKEGERFRILPKKVKITYQTGNETRTIETDNDGFAIIWYKRKDGFKVIKEEENPSKPTEAVNAYTNCKQEVKDAGYVIISEWSYEYPNYWYVGSTGICDQSKKESEEWVYDPRSPYE